MSWSTSELRVRLAPWNRVKPSSKLFYWPFQGGTSFVDLLCFFSVCCLLCLCAHLFICALWSPDGNELTSWLSFVVSSCEFVTFPLVSLVWCGTWLYRFLIFATLLIFRTAHWTRTCHVRATVRVCFWNVTPVKKNECPEKRNTEQINQNRHSTCYRSAVES